MTFTEAAVEVLRRAGKPLHFKDITELALKENLLSHVGQDPEVTMGQRLAAMAKREDGRRVLAVAPDGTFALSEWNVPAEAIVEPVAPPSVPDDRGDALCRPRPVPKRPSCARRTRARGRWAERSLLPRDGAQWSARCGGASPSWRLLRSRRSARSCWKRWACATSASPSAARKDRSTSRGSGAVSPTCAWR